MIHLSGSAPPLRSPPATYESTLDRFPNAYVLAIKAGVLIDGLLAQRVDHRGQVAALVGRRGSDDRDLWDNRGEVKPVLALKLDFLDDRFVRRLVVRCLFVRSGAWSSTTVQSATPGCPLLSGPVSIARLTLSWAAAPALRGRPGLGRS